MSYAEQLYGVRENEALSYVTDLAWFGTDSYVFRNDELMARLFNSRTGMLNPVSNFYIVKWLRQKGYSLSDYLSIGFTVALYNSDLGVNLYFVLYSFNNDGTANWISRNSYFLLPLTAVDLDGDCGSWLDMEDYTFVQYLNGTTVDWTRDMSEYVPAMANANKGTFNYYVYSKLPGFLHGLPGDATTILKPVKVLDESHNLYATVPSYDDISTLSTNIPAALTQGDRNKNFFYADKVITANIHENYILPIAVNFGNSSIVTSVKNVLNQIKTGTDLQPNPVVDDGLSASQISSKPDDRGGVYSKNALYSLSQIQESESLNIIIKNTCANMIKICM